MRRTVVALALATLVLIVAGARAAYAGTIDGVLASYVSGNEGTDVVVKTSDGRSHRLWFDNAKKPAFQGKELPWCPEFPCDGWPQILVIGKTRVHITYVLQKVDGTTVESPTRIDLLRS